MARKLNANISQGGQKIVSLDLQLYSKCIKLQVKDDVLKEFVFRIGELHVVFCALKTIGNVIDLQGSRSELRPSR